MNQSLAKANKPSQPNQTSSNRITKKYLVAMREYFSGPIPHPNILHKYEQIQKGAANRIIKMAEKQSGHRQSMENKVILSNIWNERIGMLLAFVITLSVIIGSVYLIYSDKQITGFVSLIIALGIQAYNFYTRQKKESRGVDEKKPEKK